MKDNIHSEKEILIFNAVTKLMNEGVKLHTVKVADIAKAAGIGKGTIYDYFKSKEEILEKTLIYNMDIELSEALNQIKNLNNFKDKVYKVFEIAQKSVDNYSSVTILLLSNIGTYEFKEFLNNNAEGLDNRIKLINDTIEDIIDIGYKDGIVKKQEDKEYQEQVFNSTIMGFAHLVGCKNITDKYELEKGKERAYKLLIKGLN